MNGFARRRRLIGLAAASLAGMPVASLAQAIVRTPRQTLGPFYPEKPLEQDADLVTVAGGKGVAQGEITHLSGRIVDANGKPVREARVEIWQCNAHGRYHHPRDSSGLPLDPNFQGFGASVTDAGGSYNFRTIKPVPYTGRTPHIHYRVLGRGFEPFVTQMYIAGHPQNAGDGVFMGIRDDRARSSLLANFRAIDAPGGRTEHTAQFDIVLGFTPRQG